MEHKKSTAIFYVYEHWRADTGKCFYVGKGKGNRAYSMADRSRLHREIQIALKHACLCIEVKIVQQNLTETEAFALEIKKIAFRRAEGDGLVNATNGGEGPSGRHHTDEHKAHLSNLYKGRKQSPEWVEKRASAKRGVPHSDDAKVKMKLAANLRRPASEETRRKLSESLKGKKRTPETIEKYRIAAKARGISQSTREANRIALTGRKRAPFSAETLARMSAAQKIAKAQKRAEMILFDVGGK